MSWLARGNVPGMERCVSRSSNPPSLALRLAEPNAVPCALDHTAEHDPEKWEPVFGKRSCSNKELAERFLGDGAEPATRETRFQRAPFRRRLERTHSACALDLFKGTVGRSKNARD